MKKLEEDKNRYNVLKEMPRFQKYRFFTFFSGILIKEQTCTVQQQLDYEPRRACN